MEPLRGQKILGKDSWLMTYHNLQGLHGLSTTAARVRTGPNRITTTCFK